MVKAVILNKWWSQLSGIKTGFARYRKRRQFGSESRFLQDLGML